MIRLKYFALFILLFCSCNQPGPSIYTDNRFIYDSTNKKFLTQQQAIENPDSVSWTSNEYYQYKDIPIPFHYRKFLFADDETLCLYRCGGPLGIQNLSANLGIWRMTEKEYTKLPEPNGQEQDLHSKPENAKIWIHPSSSIISGYNCRIGTTSDENPEVDGGDFWFHKGLPYYHHDNQVWKGDSAIEAVSKIFRIKVEQDKAKIKEWNEKIRPYTTKVQEVKKTLISEIE